MTDTYSPAANTSGCWHLAVACQRERLVRAGREAPATAAEKRQAIEGPVCNSKLDALK